MTGVSSQPWLRSAPVDLTLLIAPAFLSTFVAWSFRGRTHDEVSGLVWLALVVGIDVAHVYATLYRTYLDPDARRARPSLYTLVPLLGWLVGVGLYSAGPLVFWRTVAYLAVFHFVRQQYGFVRLYSRRERQRGWERSLDAAAIYVATLYPLLFWHTHLPRNYFWFLPGDFLTLPWPALDGPGAALTIAIFAAYLGKEGWRLLSGQLNLPRNLILLGTALSWYVGIVLCNGDFAFTVTNVVSHGVPYMALVWIFAERESSYAPGRRLSLGWCKEEFFTGRHLPFYLASLFVLAYLEEALWDGFIWRDHPRLFQWVRHLPRIDDSATLAWLVPLLALPQLTHYLLDGFIWRIGAKTTQTEEAPGVTGIPSFDRAL